MHSCTMCKCLRRLLLLSAVAIIVGSASHAQTNLILNGGFEAPISDNQYGHPPATWFDEASFGGWTVEFGSVDIGRDPTTWGYAYEGVQYVDLNGWHRGAIYQDISVPVGGPYVLRLALNGNYDGGTKDYRKARVELRQGANLVFRGDYTHYYNQNLPFNRQEWRVFAQQLTLTAGTYRVRLESLESRHNFFGPVVDDIRLQMVPEPATLVLAGSALPSLLLTLRRRRR